MGRSQPFFKGILALVLVWGMAPVIAYGEDVAADGEPQAEAGLSVAGDAANEGEVSTEAPDSSCASGGETEDAMLGDEEPLPPDAPDATGLDKDEAAANEGEAVSEEMHPDLVIIDTGVPEGHPNVVGAESVDGASSPYDEDGHGTGMLNVVLGEASGALVYGIRVSNDAGIMSTQAVCAALERAVSLNPRVINFSLAKNDPEVRDAIRPLVDEAAARGIAVVASAGNDGCDAVDYAMGGIDSAIVVGACDEAGARIASSNYGATVDYFAWGVSTSTAAARVSGKLLAGIPLTPENGVFPQEGGTANEDPEPGFIPNEAECALGGEDAEQIVIDAGEGVIGFVAAFTHATVSAVATDGSGSARSASAQTTSASMNATSGGRYLYNFGFSISGGGVSGGISYQLYSGRTVGSSYAWTSVTSDGARVPQSAGYRSTKLKIWLTGDYASAYEIVYAVHGLNKTYSGDWAADGEEATDENAAIDGVIFRLVPHSYRQIVQARFQNSEGAWEDYRNVVNADYEYGANVSWSRDQDETFQAASISYDAGFAPSTRQVSVYRRIATNTIKARYQNPDGSYGGYVNESSGTNYVGQVRSWARGADATFKAASASIIGTAYDQVAYANVERQFYYLDVNGRLDNVDSGTTSPMGTFDVYVNGSLKANDVSDYYEASLAGSTWSIGDIRANAGYTYDGVSEGALSGTLGTSNMQAARLRFHTNRYEVAYDGNGNNGGSTPNTTHACHAARSLASNGFTRPGYSFTGWNTKADGSGTAYAPGQSVVNLSLLDGATVRLYAQWAPLPIVMPSSGLPLEPSGAAGAMLACLGAGACFATARRMLTGNTRQFVRGGHLPLLRN